MRLVNYSYGLVIIPCFLVLAALPPIPWSTSFSEDLNLGTAAAIYFSIPERLFYAAYLVKTYPNGTKEIGGGTSFAIDTSGTTLNADRTLYLPNNSTSTSGHCVDSSNQWVSGNAIEWLPDVSGNWRLQLAVVFFYGSGAEPYRFPNSTTACIDPPFKSEQTYVIALNVTVHPGGGSVTTINPFTIPRVVPGGGASTTTVQLPATITGVPFVSNWSEHSSAITMFPILGIIASILLAQFLM
ncbi:hypothetical protein FS842_000730 [Serendipita sp. 407]|nr:hypothetical protein FS842_000730 [Serendipita sp. 407]